MLGPEIMHTERALRMLATLEGDYFSPDFYNGNWEGEEFPPSKEELVSALQSLKSQGLVASIFERLDGPCYALSEKGRKQMQEEGFLFSEKKLSETRRTFKSWLCEVLL